MTNERKIFEETYPAKKVAKNPFVAVEAIGYLRHLKLTCPEESEWIDKVIALLLSICTITELLK